VALKADSDKKTVSLILSKSQIDRLRERQRRHNERGLAVGFSDVGREVVEAGLRVLSLVGNDSLHADTKTDSSETAA
jgi:hypothetical protein